MALVFAIVGDNELMFELDLVPSSSQAQKPHVHEFVLHSSLDVVADKMWNVGTSYLRVVDEFNELQVYGFVTNSGAKFLLLHEILVEDSSKKARIEENMKIFFKEVNDLFVKLVMNPFYSHDAVIQSSSFRARVLEVAKKHSLSS